MEGFNYNSVIVLSALVIGVFFVLSLVATTLSVWFGWQPPKLLSGLFNAPLWLMVLGWIGIAFLIASALFDIPFVDLFPTKAESEIFQ